MTPLAQQAETLLFTAGEAVPIADIAKLTNASEQDVQTALADLQAAYEGHGIVVSVSDTHAHMVTSKDVSEFLGQFISDEPQELSKAALETLAIVAYRGPITRFDVDAIRGVDSRRMLRGLFLRGFLRQVRTSGKAVAYEVTEEFLSHMGVATKEDLPQFAELATHENLNHLTDSAA